MTQPDAGSLQATLRGIETIYRAFPATILSTRVLAAFARLFNSPTVGETRAESFKKNIEAHNMSTLVSQCTSIIGSNSCDFAAMIVTTLSAYFDVPLATFVRCVNEENDIHLHTLFAEQSSSRSLTTDSVARFAALERYHLALWDKLMKNATEKIIGFMIRPQIDATSNTSPPSSNTASNTPQTPLNITQHSTADWPPKDPKKLEEFTQALRKTLLDIAEIYKKFPSTSYLTRFTNNVRQVTAIETEGTQRIRRFEENISQAKDVHALVFACSSIVDSNSHDLAAMLITTLRTYFNISEQTFINFYSNRPNAYPADLFSKKPPPAEVAVSSTMTDSSSPPAASSSTVTPSPPKPATIVTPPLTPLTEDITAKYAALKHYFPDHYLSIAKKVMAQYIDEVLFPEVHRTLTALKTPPVKATHSTLDNDAASPPSAQLSHST
ncbi:MAG: hypothetical protein HY939_02135 [Gammaproteobacteria bacterium]|nr:hypothetical protein [Gammaproteobacteria bacterium]